LKPFPPACAVAAFLVLHLADPAAAFQKEAGAAKVCSECHKLTTAEAGKILGKVVDNVVAVVQGPFPGIWEVDVSRDGRTYPLYMDYSLKYLFNGKFIRVADMRNITEMRYQDLNRVDVSSIPLENAIVVGNRSATRKIVVLTDPTCPYCVKLHGEIKKAAAKEADTAFYVMPYPRNARDKATYRKCLSVVCAKSVKLLDDAYAGKELPAPSCRSDAVDETMKLAGRLKIRGTPTMILPDGRMVSGFMEADAVLALLK